MGNVLIALLVAVGFSAWVYAKLMRRTGNNTKNSIVTAAVLAVIVFFVVWTGALTIDSIIG